MKFLTNVFRQAIILLLACTFSLPLLGCGRYKVTEKTFVGKWKSSKLETPIYLYDNGEWEIKTVRGNVLQYGIWQYKDDKITWSFKIDSNIGHDVNAVLSASPIEFKVKENDGTITTFKNLEAP